MEEEVHATSKSRQDTAQSRDFMFFSFGRVGFVENNQSGSMY
jgi:hypothetical protein